MSRKAVFVDRDGTLNELVYDDVHGVLDSPRKAHQVRLIPGAALFLRGLKELGYFVVVVTNQPGIAKGTLTEQDLAEVNGRLQELLAAEGGAWDDLYYSPFHPQGGPWGRAEYVQYSECRKPSPGMLLEAAKKHDLELSQSWMIGDGLTDVQAGRAAGCRTILLTRLKIGQVERFFDLDDAEPDFIIPTLSEALETIRVETDAENDS